MPASLCLHSVNDVRLKSYSPGISNCLTLSIVGGDANVEISLFGLSRHRALAIATAIGDDVTVVYEGRGSVKLDDYLETRQVFEALEEEK
jgi:hypothetical protein